MEAHNKMASAQFFRTHLPFGDHEISSPCLFLLHGLDVLVEVRNALLHLALVTLRQPEEQWTPNWHFLVPMRREFGLATDDAGHVQGRILSPTFLRERGQVSGRRF